jgi:hypothetical protein
MTISNQTIIFTIAIGSFIIIDLIINYEKLLNVCKNMFKNKNINKSDEESCNSCNIETFNASSNTRTPSLLPQVPQPQVPQQQVPQPQVPQVQQVPQPQVPQQQVLRPQTPQQQQQHQQIVQSPIVSVITTRDAETSDMKYTELPPDMHEPLGTYDDTFTNDFDHGYTYLNTDKWSVPMRRPPVCIQEKQCPVCPTFATGTKMELKDFPTTINYAEPINVPYVQEQMNKTR